MVRLGKRGNTSDNDISSHFSEKFSDNGQCDSDVYQESVHAVNERSSQLLYTVSDNVMS